MTEQHESEPEVPEATEAYATFAEGLKAALTEAPKRVLVGTIRNIDAGASWSDAVQARLDEINLPGTLSVSGDYFHQPEVQDRMETEMNIIKDKPFTSHLYPNGSAFESLGGEQIDLGTTSHNAESLDPFSGVETSAHEPNDTEGKE